MPAKPGLSPHGDCPGLLRGEPPLLFEDRKLLGQPRMEPDTVPSLLQK